VPRYSLSPKIPFLAITYAVVALLCTRIPLLNYLGYEYAALWAFLASFVAGLATIQEIRRIPVGSGPPGRAAAEEGQRRVAASIREQLLLLLIPLGVITANALVVKNCSLPEGLAFFLLLPVVSVLFSVALGFFCAVHYRAPRAVFLGLVGGTLLYALGLGYYTPAVFSYNFFYGYFPGLTYDEVLGVSWPLVLFRALTVVLALVLVWLGFMILSRSRRDDSTRAKGLVLLKTLGQPGYRLPTLAFCAFFLLAFLLRERLGFESHAGFIQETLGRSYRTAHFVIYYDTSSFSDEEIVWVAAEHEFQRSRILEALHVSFPARIESYIYPSPEEKQRLIGAGYTNIAKPWSRQVHLTRQSLSSTLAHELVHVLAGPSGLPIIRASLSTGLVEGLAMAVGGSWGNRTLHQYAAALHRYGAPPDVAALMSLRGFALQSSSISYVLTGSFCRFLIERYGIRRLLVLYGGGGYERLYGRTVVELAEEWRKFLTRVPLSEEAPDLVDALFRRPPITRKTCARVIARRNDEAGKKYEQKDYAQAAALYESSFDETADYNALSGYLASSLRLHRYNLLVAAWDSALSRDAHPAQYLPLSLMIGDALWGSGDMHRAAELYTWCARTNISERMTEAAKLRFFAVSDSSRRRAFSSYFLSDAGDSTRLVLLDSMALQIPGSWITLYLKGSVLQRMEKFEASLPVLQSFELAEIDPLLEAFRQRMIGRGLFRLKRFRESKVVFWNSLNFYRTETAVRDVYELVDRCDWMNHYAFP
jgi:hypothetical protein